MLSHSLLIVTLRLGLELRPVGVGPGWACVRPRIIFLHTTARREKVKGVCICSSRIMVAAVKKRFRAKTQSSDIYLVYITAQSSAM